MMPRLTRRRLVACGVAAAAVAGACNLRNPGVTPPRGALSFPIALGLSQPRRDARGEQSSRFLYVANSNFDLRYNAGTLQVYDLDALDALLERGSCRQRNQPVDGGTISVPNYTRPPLARPVDAGVDGGDALDGAGPESDAELPLDADASNTPVDGAVADAGELVDGAVADASTIVLTGREPDADREQVGYLCDTPSTTDKDSICCVDRAEEIGSLLRDQRFIDSYATGMGIAAVGGSDRLYVPISSRSRLLHVDVDGEGRIQCESPSGRCSQGPGVGRPDEEPDAEFPGQPETVAVGKLSELGVDDPARGEHRFVLIAHEAGDLSLTVDDGVRAPTLESVLKGFATRPTSIALDRQRKLAYVSFSSVSHISRVGVTLHPERRADEPGARELLFESSQILLPGLSQPRDVRDLAVDPADPDRLFAVVRGQFGAPLEAIAFLRLDPSTSNEARLIDAVRVGAGPSKFEHVQFPNGRSFLLVSCYDERSIYIIDASTRELEFVVRNIAGPHELAFDGARQLLYVTDFRLSVLRVVDLAGLIDRAQPSPRVVATLGSPRDKGGFE